MTKYQIIFKWIKHDIFVVSDDDDSEASVLQKVDLPIIDINVCQHSYRNENKRVNPSIHLCAGYVQGGKDTCQGLYLLKFLNVCSCHLAKFHKT